MKEKFYNLLQLLIDDITQAIIAGSKSIVILIFGIWFAKIISVRVRKILLKATKDEMLSNFLAKVAFVGLLILAIVITLGTMGVQTTSIIAALGAAGLAIALALKDSLSNLASGIMLVIFRPFTKDDMIEINGLIGIIEDISLFHTYMRMADGKLVILPNTNIATSEVINYTRRHTKVIQKEPQTEEQKIIIRRIDWLVGVSYTSDIDKTREIIKAAVLSTQNINDGKNDASKEIFVGVNELQASAIEFVVRAWVIDNSGFLATRSQMIENVKKALDSAQIEIPYNKLDVNLLK